MQEPKDAKYVVIKRETVSQLLHELVGIVQVGVDDPYPRMCARFEKSVLDDAVVLRLGDVFAGPALAAYSSGIAVAEHVVELVTDHPDGVDRAMKSLMDTADYFADRSAESIGMDVKLPD